MFHVKICGITSAHDAVAAVAAGADAVGLNFVQGSPRRVGLDRAAEIVAALPAGVRAVGVFAGTDAARIREVVARAGLHAVQLHGHLAATGDAAHDAAVDPPERCAALEGIPVIRAIRLEHDGLASARAWFAAARRLGHAPQLALVDARPAAGADAGRLGGTGAQVDWQALAAAGPFGVPLVLAGGLDAGNVAEALRRTGLRAVDVASGVESAPGVKDPALVRAFVSAARSALGLP